MAAYVLVHGAWHGGWCWQKVAPPLREAGHEVFTPTLTGLGERRHLATPEVDLDTHITDIVNVLTYEDLTDTVLVGHSYGGMVIAGVADRAPERVGRLVYLDAFVPNDGEAVVDHLSTERVERLDADVRADGEGWRIPHGPPEAYGVADAVDIAWASPRLVQQPVRTFRQPIRLQHPSTSPATFVLCSKCDWFVGFAEQARQQRGWEFRELPTDHMAMVTMPNELVDLLLGVA